MTHVWRLTVTLPEGSDAPGWEPHIHQLVSAFGYHPRDGNPEWEFHWPHRRQYLSRGSAHTAAKQLRSLGATVEVERSLPVQWSTCLCGKPERGGIHTTTTCSVKGP